MSLLRHFCKQILPPDDESSPSAIIYADTPFPFRKQFSGIDTIVEFFPQEP